jgi:protein involved in temperature-dependent protein secretion
MQMTQTAETYDERVKVESWRLHVLMEAGYPVTLAERVAHSNADLHQAVALVQAGCAPDLAAEILI